MESTHHISPMRRDTSTSKPLHKIVSYECKSTFFSPRTYLLLIATTKTVTMVPRKPAGCLMESAHHVFSIHRVHRDHLSPRASPVTYMYVVSAKIIFLSPNLSPSHSYYQHGHDGTSETRGEFDGERSLYFIHAPSAPRSPFNTCKPGHLYVRWHKIPIRAPNT